jgi:chromosome segregation protein
MFLRSLGMKGFKSFADPTTVEFEPGITVVVGPNGSGKSNVVDAITWVMGAQGPRTLRSAKMEDVIFAGTAARAALGRAEVSLTIDNSSGRLPLDMAEVTITRTLFRSGDSEYAINGAACRLLDIQELLSDTGVGRQQHMIVGQGQLDAVLNARPEDRRAIIEDAAGVRKHRQRRERAERRLAGTSENLERLADLVREVRRQIRPLERQATAARAHASMATELDELRRHLIGLELAELESRRVRANGGLEALAAQESELAGALSAVDQAATDAAAELASRREEELAGSLGRVQALAERARGTTHVVAERRAAVVAALEAAADTDVVSALESEAARLDAELRQAEVEAGSLEPESRRLASVEQQLRADEQAHLDHWGDGGDLRAAQEAFGVAQARVEMGRRAVQASEATLQAVDERIAALLERQREATETDRELELRGQQLADRSTELHGAVLRAETAALAARTDADAAEERLAGAERERHRSAARAEALDRALRELQGSAGREVLTGGDGVVGALVELVEIDRGYEGAFEAAVGASVAAVVVDGRRAARQALARLRSQGASGAVLAAADGSPPWSGVPGPPTDAEPLRPHVRARHGAGEPLERVLDAVLASAVAVDGWEEAIDLALERPDLVVVTTEGDRFARSGWRVRPTSRLVTVAAVDEAHERAVDAATEADRAGDVATRARAALDEARTHAVAATRALDRHEAETAGFAADRNAAEAAGTRLAAELAQARAAQLDAQGAVSAEAGRLAQQEASLPVLAGAVEEAQARADAAAAGRRELSRRRAEWMDLNRAHQVNVASVAERRRVFEERQRQLERRLAGHAQEREVAAARRLRLEANVIALARLADAVASYQSRLEVVQQAVRDDYRRQLDAVRAGGARLESLQRDRGDIERRLADVREQVRTLDHEAAQVEVRTEALGESVRREFAVEPSELVGTPCPELPEGAVAAEHAEALANRLGSLGPINPLALEELSLLEERHRELETQSEDVRVARRELQEVIRTLDRQIAETFAAALTDVNEHFSALVSLLFPGGTGRLIMTEPEDLLNTGVEIEVRPPGRNVRRVSLLSGGERSLSALAFLFAVFRSRPSPFYVLDEVEAALDDVNLHRFLDMVDDFRNEAQLIIVSHQKRTMEAADALYGVTMAPGGSSQVVSQRVARESERAAS